MIKPRQPLERVNNEQQFAERAENNDLTILSLEQLVERYNQIDKQSQLFKGLILLEARERFLSDKEFGQWVATVGLSDSSRFTRSTYMNLARFFKNRDMTGISMTAAYEISAPCNADIAEEIYSIALFKNLPVAEVKRQIALKKGIEGTSILPTSVEKQPVTDITPEPTLDITPVAPKDATDINESSAVELIVHDVLKGFDVGIKLKILRECLTIVNTEMRPK